MSKHSAMEADVTLQPKVTFLNSVFLFAGIVAFGMGFLRWQSSVLLGSIDFVFSLCSFALVYYLNNHKERVAAISSIALALSYCLFTAIYLLAPYNTSRISLFFLLLASAFFLKGKQAGLAWLIIILTTVVAGHFLSGFDTAYSHIDIVTTNLYLLALFFIFINYEKFKEKVNERELDKEVLRLSEKRFRTMVDNGNDIIGIISDTGMMRFISPSVEPVLGFEPGEMIGRHVSDLIHPDEQPKAATALANALAHPGGETLERYEFRMKHKDGSYRDIEMVGRNLIGNPVIGGIVLNGRDITGRKQTEDALRESQARQSAILNNSPYLVWLKDTEGRYLKANKTYIDYARLKDAGQIIGKTDFDLWPKELAEKYRADDAEVMSSRQQKHVEEPSLDGEVMHWVETFKTPVIDENGNVLGTTGFARDVTERKQAEQALAESESRFREIFNTVSDAIFIHDAATGRIMDVNRRMCEMYGFTREEVLACGPDDLSAGTPPYSSAEAAEKIHLASIDGPQTFEWLARARDGHLFWVEVSLRFASISGKPRILATVRDITDRKQAEEQIHKLAFYDMLTELPNRRLLNDRLEQAIASSKRRGHYGALMFLDLDNFKPLNDTYGHGVGDLLLVEVANRLTACVREVDTVARFGGDEFVVMLNELDAGKAGSAAQAGMVAEKIRSALAEPYLLKIRQEGKAEKNIRHHCAASIGVVVFNGEASAEDVVKWADMAMYQAKELGRNRVKFFDSES